MMILAIDLGKFKSVACLFTSPDAEQQFHTVNSDPDQFRKLITLTSPARRRTAKGAQLIDPMRWLACVAMGLFFLLRFVPREQPDSLPAMQCEQCGGALEKQ